MKNNLIARISNGFGNQMFLYATAFAFSKKLNKELLLDVYTGPNQLIKKNLKKRFKHYKPKYELSVFDISSKVLPRKFTFDTSAGYFKRKFFLFLDKFYKKKQFIIEYKDSFKKTFYSDSYLKKNYQDTAYIEGYFESEKYFFDFRSELLKEFQFTHKINCSKNYYDQITNSNSVSLAIRRDRYNERFDDDNDEDKVKKTHLFENLQYDYIVKSIGYFKSHIDSPKFFLFSDSFDNLDKRFFDIEELIFIKDNLTDKGLEDFYLMSKCKHFAVAPTSFHWWAAWLNTADNKIVLRPSNNVLNPSDNINFWPENWISI
jgi:hypothetical protein